MELREGRLEDGGCVVAGGSFSIYHSPTLAFLLGSVENRNQSAC